jgi:hypothetical protein
MKLTDQLSADVPPILRDYIHAAIDEALAPLRKQMAANHNHAEEMVRQASRSAIEMNERFAALSVSGIAKKDRP